jgi:N-acetylmuramic acid 6-phosphate etherase
MFYVGAGPSGRLGVLDASECPPTFGTQPEMVQGIIAGGTPALTKAQEGAEDNPEGAAEGHRGARHRRARFRHRHRRVGDHALRARGARGGAQARRRDGDHRLQPAGRGAASEVDIAILPITGPEVLTGSTRMKAGHRDQARAQHISTGVMIRLGKTFGNLMVDLRATNEKLKDRSERILMEVCGIERDAARALLREAKGHVKTAIVMQKLKLSRADAERALDDAGGVIRRATREDPPPV